MNATKLAKVFAKPFIAALDGHSDGVWCTTTSPTSLVAFLSGATDGEVRVWDLPRHKTLWSVYAHSSFVRGIVVAQDGASFFSCSDDKSIKQFRLAAFADEEDRADKEDEDDTAGGYQVEPLNTWSGDAPFLAIDHSWNSTNFATAARSVDVWDLARSKPIHSFTWGADSIIALKYNPSGK